MLEEFREYVRKWIRANTPEELKEKGSTIPFSGRYVDNLDELKRWHRKVYEAGLLGISWPKEYGGYGDDPIKELIAYEEFMKAKVPYGNPTAGIGMSIVGPSLIIAGSEDQKRKYVKRILTGEDIWCQGFSEPQAGSDLASIQTRAEDKGEYFEITGQKIWSSYAHLADYMILLARTGKPEDRHKGLTMFIVDMRSQGITVKPIRQITGKSEFNMVYFNNLKVPKENVIGKVNEGWKIATLVLNNERVNLSIPFILAAENALRNVLSNFKEKQKELELSILNLYATKLLYNRMLELYGKRKSPPGIEAAILKIISSEVLQEFYEFGVNNLDKETLIFEEPLSEASEFSLGLIASRAATIGGGSSEVLRNLIGESILKLPR
ncbi:acyl-CoA dehydrogenase [Candidatus Acidianus copahuensis]|uniref:Acyl-CoA dehydrogenase n=1 Tax=Candidatus Acidianus copahuensis TaxID=1160895 RepID=A0A031LV83_9CREN|nr:acyl-CoA dehydrogenase [Candidatus Acidianus copahuensis]